MEIHDHILQTLGNTPLVRLSRFSRHGAPLAAKIESFNPGSSVKDRIGLAMIEAAEEAGQLQPGGLIVEPTSGNTGVGLVMAAILKGYRLICTAAEKIPKEKVALLEAYGAKVIICPLDVEPDDPRSYYKVAERIRDEEGAFLPYQYYNQANPGAHYKTTGPEIWRQTDGKITHWVAGIGTGGTLTGSAKFLKEQNPAIRVIGVDPVGSIYAYYQHHGVMPPPEEQGTYLTDGIGGSIKAESAWLEYVDDIISMDDKTAYQTTLELARTEAIFGGSSSGAAAAGARRIAAELPPEALVVTLFPDSGERYLSRLNEEWMRAKGLLDEP